MNEARRATLLAACVAAASPAALHAQEGDKGPKITVGLGAGANIRHEGSDEYRPIPFIVARARWGARYFVGTDGEGFRADVVGLRFVEAGPAVNFRFSRGDGVDDPVIAALPQVDRAIEVGGFLNLNFPLPFGGNDKDALTIGATSTWDVAGGHGGRVIRTTLLYRGLVTDNLIVQAGPLANYASRDFADAYYGVDAAGSFASGLPSFSAGAGWKDVGVRASIRYLFGPHWNLNVAASYKRLIGDAADSPIVSLRGDEDVFFGGAALAYTF